MSKNNANPHHIINNVQFSPDSISPPQNTFFSPSGIIESAIVHCEFFVAKFSLRNFRNGYGTIRVKKKLWERCAHLFDGLVIVVMELTI